MSIADSCLHRSLREVQGYSALVVGGLMSPLAPGGIIAALLLIVIFPRLEGHFIFGIALACFCLGNLLMAVTPTMNWEITVYLAQAIIVLGSGTLPRTDPMNHGADCCDCARLLLRVGVADPGQFGAARGTRDDIKSRAGYCELLIVAGSVTCHETPQDGTRR